ncbi:MAG: hypothetical protein RLZ33_2740 [Bacteroidota bacterium]|jgi:hypothetical protein
MQEARETVLIERTKEGTISSKFHIKKRKFVVKELVFHALSS